MLGRDLGLNVIAQLTDSRSYYAKIMLIIWHDNMLPIFLRT